MTNPIDLKALERRWRKNSGVDSDVAALISTVEALRTENAKLKRVADAKPEELNQELLDEVEALREQVEIIAGERNWHRKDRGSWRILANHANDRAKAAEAHAAKLAVALERILAHTEAVYEGEMYVKEVARTALATTPSEALERAKAMDNGIAALRFYARNEVDDVVKEALDRIDALDPDKQEPTL